MPRARVPPTTSPAGRSRTSLSGDESFARKARRGPPDRLRSPPRADPTCYMAYMGRSLAFDWLYGFAGFDAALKDRVAGELVEGAQRMMALQSLANPAQASYHNHTVRELALAVFALAAVEGHPSVEARAAPLREQAAPRPRQHPGDDRPREPGGRLPRVDGLHAHHLGAARPDGRAAPHDHGRRSRRARFGVFRTMGPTYLYKVLPDGSTARDDDNEFPHLDARRQRRARLRRPSLQGPVRGLVPPEERLAARALAHSRCSSSCGRTTAVVPRDPATTTAAELPRRAALPAASTT